MLLKKIDVILASYNGERYLKEQINSILLCLDKVKGHECRILISDDGSKDSTLNILSAIKDDRVKLIDSSRAGGVIANFERLMKYSNANYVFFSDQDDVWLEDKIAVFIDAFNNIEIERGNIPVLLYSDAILVDRELNEIHNSMMEVQKIIKEPTFCELLVSNSVTGCTMAANRELLNKVNKLKADNVIMHDWYLALIAKSIGFLKFIPGKHVLYRQHGGNQVGSKAYKISDKINPRNISEFIKISRKNIIRTIHQASYFRMEYANKHVSPTDLNNLNFYIDAEWSFLKRIQIIFSGKFKKMGKVRSLMYVFIYLTM